VGRTEAGSYLGGKVGCEGKLTLLEVGVPCGTFRIKVGNGSRAGAWSRGCSVKERMRVSGFESALRPGNLTHLSAKIYCHGKRKKLGKEKERKLENATLRASKGR